MHINSATLQTIMVGLKTNYQGGFDDITTNPAVDHWSQIAFEVPSDTREEEYGWLKDFGVIREWLGDRVVNNIAEDGYRVKNRDFEKTIGVKRNDIADNKLFSGALQAKTLGADVRAFPNKLVFPLLKAGASTKCFDGQYFFDTDHPVQQADGSLGSVSNIDSSGAAGAPYWYLMDTTKAIKPILFQKRKAFEFNQITRSDDSHVFSKNEYLYGVDGRCNVGYGFWQLAYASNAVLNADSIAAARAAMMKLKSDKGEPLGIVPNLLVVGPDHEYAALKAVEAQYMAGGGSNVMYRTTKLLSTPWLA